jgi:hypothetical protein
MVVAADQADPLGVASQGHAHLPTLEHAREGGTPTHVGAAVGAHPDSRDVPAALCAEAEARGAGVPAVGQAFVHSACVCRDPSTRRPAVGQAFVHSSCVCRDPCTRWPAVGQAFVHPPCVCRDPCTRCGGRSHEASDRRQVDVTAARDDVGAQDGPGGNYAGLITAATPRDQPLAEAKTSNPA